MEVLAQLNRRRFLQCAGFALSTLPSLKSLSAEPSQDLKNELTAFIKNNIENHYKEGNMTKGSPGPAKYQTLEAAANYADDFQIGIVNILNKHGAGLNFKDSEIDSKVDHYLKEQSIFTSLFAHFNPSDGTQGQIVYLAYEIKPFNMRGFLNQEHLNTLDPFLKGKFPEAYSTTVRLSPELRPDITGSAAGAFTVVAPGKNPYIVFNSSGIDAVMEKLKEAGFKTKKEDVISAILSNECAHCIYDERFKIPRNTPVTTTFAGQPIKLQSTDISEAFSDYISLGSSPTAMAEMYRIMIASDVPHYQLSRGLLLIGLQEYLDKHPEVLPEGWQAPHLNLLFKEADRMPELRNVRKNLIVAGRKSYEVNLAKMFSDIKAIEKQNK